MVHKRCINLEKNWMFFNGALDKGTNHISFCCAKEASNIRTTLCDDPEETLQNYMRLKQQIINESIRLAAEGGTSDCFYYNTCSRCAGFKESIESTMSDDALIHFICYGMTPAPCQAKCIYCSQNLIERRKYNKELDEAGHQLIFKHMEYFKEKGLFAKDILFNIASGEITIHPYKNKLYEIVGDASAGWLTNCFSYNKEISNNLQSNPQSYILFSMDSGNAKTWKKIKGINNFYEVKENIKRYTHEANDSYQIWLKYIVLPGINDDIENIHAFIQFAVENKLKRIDISRNRYIKEIKDDHVTGAALLAALAYKNNLKFSFMFYSADELGKIVTVANYAADKM